jgi:hypothetical protein
MTIIDGYEEFLNVKHPKVMDSKTQCLKITKVLHVLLPTVDEF